MKLISWNVNGLRAVMNKGFNDFFESIDADIFCIQETKLQEGQIDYKPDGYFVYWNSAVKKGYSGTAVFSKIEPKKVTYGINIEEHDQEGRVITLEFEKFYLVNCYTPNSQRELTRLEYRMKWENDFREYLKELNTKKPVILCGDLNVAHNEIDLKNPTSNRHNAGFTDEERNKMTELLKGYLEKCKCEVAVLHAGCEEEAIKYMEAIKNLPNISSIKIAEISPALGVHSGPGLFGFSVKMDK